MRELADLPVARRVRELRVWGHYLGFLLDAGKAAVCDLSTGKVITAADERQTVRFLDGSGTSAVYLLSAAREDGGADWTIESLDLRTGGLRVLGRGATPAKQATEVPRPAVEWPWVVWLDTARDDENAGGGKAIHVVDLRTGKSERLESSAAGTAGATRDMVVYDAAPPSGGDGRDLFVVEAHGGTPRQFTDHGGVQEFDVANGWVVWKRRLGVEDPEEVWIAPVDRSRPPTKLGQSELVVPAQGGRPPGYLPAIAEAVPGSGFLIGDQRGKQLVVFDVGGSTGTSMPLHDAEKLWRDPGAGWDVDGSVVVWMGIEMPLTRESPRHLKIMQIERGPGP